MVNLSYKVSSVVNNSILEIIIDGNMSGSNKYKITNAGDGLMLYGEIEGKIKRTCLYVGGLPPGQYCFQIEEFSKEQFSVFGIL